MFDIIHEVHVPFGYGSRDRIVNEGHQNTKTQEAYNDIPTIIAVTKEIKIRQLW